jgi:hypothetical protein
MSVDLLDWPFLLCLLHIVKKQEISNTALQKCKCTTCRGETINVPPLHAEGIRTSIWRPEGFLCFPQYLHKVLLQYTSFSIVTRSQAGQYRNCGLTPGKSNYFSLLKNVESGSGVHGTSYSMAFPLEVQRLWCDSESSHPSRADIRKELRYTSTTRYAFMASTGTDWPSYLTLNSILSKNWPWRLVLVILNVITHCWIHRNYVNKSIYEYMPNTVYHTKSDPLQNCFTQSCSRSIYFKCFCMCSLLLKCYFTTHKTPY